MPIPLDWFVNEEPKNPMNTATCGGTQKMEDDKMEAAVDAVMVAVGCAGDGTVVAKPEQVREWLRLAYGYGKCQGGADEKARLRVALSL